jgi:putative transposase
MREILKAIFYLICGGILWEILPQEFPNWKTDCHYFRLWRSQGRWKAIRDRLRQEGPERAPPSALGSHP